MNPAAAAANQAVLRDIESYAERLDQTRASLEKLAESDATVEEMDTEDYGRLWGRVHTLEEVVTELRTLLDRVPA